MNDEVTSEKKIVIENGIEKKTCAPSHNANNYICLILVYVWIKLAFKLVAWMLNKVTDSSCYPMPHTTYYTPQCCVCVCKHCRKTTKSEREKLRKGHLRKGSNDNATLIFLRLEMPWKSNSIQQNIPELWHKNCRFSSFLHQCSHGVQATNSQLVNMQKHILIDREAILIESRLYPVQTQWSTITTLAQSVRQIVAPSTATLSHLYKKRGEREREKDINVS